MNLIKTEKQKDNTAKFFYNVSLVLLATTVIAPIAKPETLNLFSFIIGLIASILSFTFASILDGKEIKV